MFSNQDSLWLRSLIRTFASPKKVYPTQASGVTLTTGTESYGLGNFAEIVPANTITKRFRIDIVGFAVFSVAQTFEVVFYKGNSGSEEEIGRLRTNPGATTNGLIGEMLFTELIPANTRISARACTYGATPRTVACSIGYHIDEE